jgi:hypothetical protein
MPFHRQRSLDGTWNAKVITAKREEIFGMGERFAFELHVKEEHYGYLSLEHQLPTDVEVHEQLAAETRPLEGRRDDPKHKRTYLDAQSSRHKVWKEVDVVLGLGMPQAFLPLPGEATHELVPDHCALCQFRHNQRNEKSTIPD